MPPGSGSRKSCATKRCGSRGYQKQLRDQCSQRLVARGVSTEDRWKSKPKEKLTPIEQQRLDRQRYNKRNWARKEREKSRQEMASLKNSNTELELKIQIQTSEISKLTKLKEYLKKTLVNHRCIRRGEAKPAHVFIAKAKQRKPRFTRPITVEVGEDGILRRPSKKRGAPTDLQTWPNNSDEDDEEGPSTRGASGFRRIKGTNLVIHGGQVFQLNPLPELPTKSDRKESAWLSASSLKPEPEDSQEPSEPSLAQSCRGNGSGGTDVSQHENATQSSNSAPDGSQGDRQMLSGGFSIYDLNSKSFLELLQSNDGYDQDYRHVDANSSNFQQSLSTITVFGKDATGPGSAVVEGEIAVEFTDHVNFPVKGDDTQLALCSFRVLHDNFGSASFPEAFECDTAVVTPLLKDTQPECQLGNHNHLQSQFSSIPEIKEESWPESRSSALLPSKEDDNETNTQPQEEPRQDNSETSSDCSITSVSQGGSKTGSFISLDMLAAQVSQRKPRLEMPEPESPASGSLILPTKKSPRSAFVNPWAVDDVACHVEITTCDTAIMTPGYGDAGSPGARTSQAASPDFGGSVRQAESDPIDLSTHNDPSVDTAGNFSIHVKSTTTTTTTTNNTANPTSRTSPGIVAHNTIHEPNTKPGTTSISTAATASEGSVKKTEQTHVSQDLTHSGQHASHSLSSNPTLSRSVSMADKPPTETTSPEWIKIEVDEDLIKDIFPEDVKAEIICKRSLSDSLETGSDVSRAKYRRSSSSSALESSSLHYGNPPFSYPSTPCTAVDLNSPFNFRPGRSFDHGAELRSDSASVMSF